LLIRKKRLRVKLGEGGDPPGTSKRKDTEDEELINFTDKKTRGVTGHKKKAALC